VQINVEGDELCMGRDDLADPTRVEDERGFAQQTGAALAPQFAPEIAALQRMHILLQKGEIELQDVVQQAHRLDAGGLGALKDRLDVLGRVVEVPGAAIDFLPIGGSHHAMASGDVLEIVFIHVGVHPHRVLVQ